MSDPTVHQSVFRDLVALTKPSIAGLSMFMTIGGYLLAGAGDVFTTLWAVIGTALIVGSANALNMAWEHETDALMTRTAERPIPAGRLSVRTAGSSDSLGGKWPRPLPWRQHANGLDRACVSRSLRLHLHDEAADAWALLVGAVPGAAPPLIGWTASTDNLGWPGLLLFGVLFIWQIPHFLAISLYRREDYAGAGIQIWPVARGKSRPSASRWPTPPR